MNDNLSACLSLLAAMAGQPAWNDDVATLYSMHLAEWHPEVRQAAVWEASRARFRPSVGELREMAVRIFCPMPSLAELRSEIRRVIVWHGTKQDRDRAATPLCRLLADELGGWSEVGRTSTEEFDRAFASAAERAKSEWVAREADAVLAQAPGARLIGAAVPSSSPRALGAAA